MRNPRIRASFIAKVCLASLLGLAILCSLGCSSSEPTLATAKPGDVITYGQYFVDTDDELDDLEWIVLANEDNRLFLLTKDIVLYAPYAYADDYTEYTDPEEPWKSSQIREVLNGNLFYGTAFTEEEQAAIETLSDDAGKYKVFLPGQSEVLEYLSEDQYGATYTPYAESLRSISYEGEDGEIWKTLEDRIGQAWVLRETLEERPTSVMLISESGTPISGLNDDDGNRLLSFPIQGHYGIRPVIIVDVP